MKPNVEFFKHFSLEKKERRSSRTWRRWKDGGLREKSWWNGGLRSGEGEEDEDGVDRVC